MICRVGKGSVTTCCKGASNYVFPNLCNLNDRTACKNPSCLNWVANGTMCLSDQQFGLLVKIQMGRIEGPREPH